MSENLDVFDAVKKQDLFMEVRGENRKKFIGNIVENSIKTIYNH